MAVIMGIAVAVATGQWKEWAVLTRVVPGLWLRLEDTPFFPSCSSHLWGGRAACVTEVLNEVGS